VIISLRFSALSYRAWQHAVVTRFTAFIGAHRAVFEKYTALGYEEARPSPRLDYVAKCITAFRSDCHIAARAGQDLLFYRDPSRQRVAEAIAVARRSQMQLIIGASSKTAIISSAALRRTSTAQRVTTRLGCPTGG